MHIAPLPPLSYAQFIMGNEDVVAISRFALEALLRAAVPGFCGDDLDVASYLSPCSDTVPITRDVWRDELAHLVRNASEDRCETKASDVDIQWFDDVKQAIDFGAISEAPLALVNRLC
jgi:hypothetical protein